MKRQVTLEEISDGRLYGLNDMVKADCKGCAGCSACCHGMGESIILTPLDVYRLEQGLKVSFGELMIDKIELHVVDGLILPNLKMQPDTERCAFLNPDGRCSIHAYRPDICRLFPLGRFYEEKGFRYFLQIHECPKTDRAKIKVKKWLDIPDLKQHESFIQDWHDYLNAKEDALECASEEERKQANMQLLKQFYIRPYDTDCDFYAQFYQRFKEENGI